MLAIALVLVLAIARIAYVLTSPSVDAVCEHVLALATTIGERVGAPEREQCHAVMAGRREALGLRRWAGMSRCIVAARSFDEAGACR
jgi:hypothetical protein